MPKTKHVVAVAGRRIDPEMNEGRRFPFDRVPNVERALSRLIDQIGVSALVSSAACGADLLALKTAIQKGIPMRIILPFDVEKFKASSVLDRPMPEYWGTAFEIAIATARAHGEIINLGRDYSDATSYSAANKAIIETAHSLTKSTDARPIAIVIWEGAARDGADATDEFQALAKAANFDIRMISTL